MTAITILILIAWLFSIVGWWNESRFRKKTVKGIKRDIEREIGWIELNHYQDVQQGEYKAFKEAYKIVDQYDFDKREDELCEK